MRKINILGIAPYEGMKNMMEALCEYRADVSITTYIADLDSAVTLISGLDLESYDAILSRGGTYLALKKVTTLPVFDIELSYYDIINAIKLAEGMNLKMGIVAYPNIATLTRQICEILNYDIDIFITDSWEDTTAHIDYMKEKGYQLVIGDMSACRYSKESGISSILFSSGSETIKKAIDQIVNFSNYYLDYQIENRIIKSGMISRKEIMLIFNSDQSLYTSTVKAPDPFLVRSSKRLIPELDKFGNAQAVRISQNTTYTISGNKLTISGSVYYHFHIQIGRNSEIAFTGSLSKINDSPNESLFFKHIYNSPGFQQIRSSINKIASSNTPVFIEGNGGTGKDRLAETIHAQSRYKNTPMYLINCATLTDKELKSLINNTDSPFYFDYSIFYFKNCHCLSQLLTEQLLTYIHISNLAQKNLLLFSWSKENTTADNFICHNNLINKTGCIHLMIPDLNYFTDEIPKLVNIQINQLNISSGVQISGMEPEAISLLQGYRWTHNLYQLKRVVTSAFYQTTSPYIKATTISDILRKETAAYSSPTNDEIFNTDLSLKEIEYSIIMQVLKRENFNQSRTARKLQISRTTLWHILNSY